MKKFFLFCLITLITLTSVFAQGSSENYPSRDITILVPVKAGGDTDSYARIFAQYLQEELGVGVAVKNVDGASGTVGCREVYNSKADGYTVLFFHGTTLLSEITGLTDLDTFDFTIASAPVVDTTATLVAPANKFADAADFKKRAESGEKIIASIAQGSYAQLACVLYDDAVGGNFTYVDSTSAADRIADMLGGRIDLFFSQYGTISQYIESGDFISLGVLSDERNEFFSDVPTLKEQGVDITMDKIFFFAFPPKTDQSIVDAFNAAVEKICSNADAIADFAKYYITPEFKSQADSIALLKDAKAIYEQYTPQLLGEN